ncbi:MAG: hypothetical protein ED557_14565 [Balneola sp.]|nr:MAG: hypothetical protein ED557_14565 [Balneola sp.]
MKTFIATFLILIISTGLGYAQSNSLLISSDSTFSTPGTGNTVGQILMNSYPSNRTLQILPQRTGDGDLLNGYVFDVSYTNSGATNGFLFRTGSNNRMIINESGNVGIGLTNPMRELDIDGSIELSGSIYGKTTDYTYYTIANGGNYNHAFYTRTNTGASSERFRIEGGAIIDDILISNSNFNVNSGQLYVEQSTGKVGIGITNPYSDLQVDGSFGVGKFSTSNTSGFMINYVDGGSGTTTFKQNRWGAHYYFKRNSSSGEETQFYLGSNGGAGNRMDIYNADDEVKVRLHSTSDSYFTGGEVGIGTTNPSRLLHVNGSTTDVVSAFESTDSGTQIALTDNSGSLRLGTLSNGGFALSVGGDASSTTGENVTEAMRVTSAGDIGIGTTTPGNKLEVNGSIRSKEVIVEATGWPDYVFHADYELSTLAEIEAYIKAKGHLPEIPSAEEVEEEGQLLGEMQQLLLKKIEEMTLHLIVQEKAIDKGQKTEEKLIRKLAEQEAINNHLQVTINELIKRIERLEQGNEE